MAAIQGIQNPTVDYVDQAAIEAATAASEAALTASEDVATLEGRVTALEAATEPSYGEVYEDNEAGSAISLTSNAAFYPWATGAAGTVKGAGYVTASSSTLVVGASGAGLYMVTAHFAGTLGAANELKSAVFKNEVEQGHLRIDQDITNTAKYQNGSMAGLLALVEGDIVSLRFGSDTNTQTFTMKHCNLSIVRIG